ncbi:MAG: helix-turn-helix domain-containing protein [Candidatus Levybacteria bacterium]|nr:helix-turn-helix domain-containing protein [Candidatus Levybacteria bacterium]
MIKVGQLLRDERVRRGLTIEEISKATKIRTNFLSAIEKGEYRNLPSSAYAQGFVRNYVEFLGLPKRETMAWFRREFDEKALYKVLPDGFARQQDIPMQRIRVQQTVIIIGALLFTLVAYLTFQYRYAIVNPPLSIDEPKEGKIVTGDAVEVVGDTDPNATIFVNDNAVSVDKDGGFTKQLDVFEGQTTITVKAVNRFGKETVVERHIQVK